MERLLRLQLLATSTKPTKSRFLQLGQRLIDKCKQTTFFSQGTQGRAQQRRPTRRSRRKNGNEIPDPLITPYRGSAHRAAYHDWSYTALSTNSTTYTCKQEIHYVYLSLLH
ncbi:uncharacterized protein LOC143815994 isoform X2 [Ranitomeya variabilis]|uniref:uncharacterized protein LOC143815994 isoform X2 n=1 Tax=Ranitomeya variabilis TaxID=490064 RepID=UPI004056A959